MVRVLPFFLPFLMMEQLSASLDGYSDDMQMPSLKTVLGQIAVEPIKKLTGFVCLQS